MSRIKDSLPDYLDLDYEKAVESYSFKLELEDYIDRGEFQDNSLLREFLEDILPYEGPNHFIMVSDKDRRTKNLSFTREKCIDALCCLCQYELTLYYHPASFTDWIENKYAVAFRSLVVDIDDVGLIADETEYEDVVNFLQNELGFTPDRFPKWVSLSGHGMHLVMPIDEYTVKDEELRCGYLESLIVTAGGDISGRPVSHMFRCPTSYNLKERPIKGKLFKMNDSTDRDIHRLDWCLKYGDEYETYKAIRNEKGKKPRERHKQEEKDFLERLGDTSVTELLAQQNISEKDRLIATKILKREMKRNARAKAANASKSTSDEAAIDDEAFEETLYYDNPLETAENFV